MKVMCVVGVRPSIIKMAPVVMALEARGANVSLVHTGQHYDPNMSDVFFDDLDLRRPDVCLGVGSGLPGRQTSRVLCGVEEAIRYLSPDRVVVVGDTNSTVGAALAAVKQSVPLAHVEAGLRSFDRSMPEEINRLVVDAIADTFFCTEPAAVGNLEREGHAEGIHAVGNTVADSVDRLLPKSRVCDVLTRFQLDAGRYGLVTLHRPANVDDHTTLARILWTLRQVCRRLPLVWPIHPRIAPPSIDGLRFVPPLSYIDCLSLTSEAAIVLTDSGGIQEETTILGVPCATLRENTERPITLDDGTGRLVGSDPDAILAAVDDALTGSWRTGRGPARRPGLWDGHAGERIADAILREGSGS